MSSIAKQKNRGSEWRKWDLHVHTPASYDWDGKCKATENEIVDAALKGGISAIAIADHHSIDFVDKTKAYGNKNGLLVLPGVELRTDKGNKKIHIIALFDESVSGKFIYDKILCPLHLSEDDRKKKGEEQVYCDFEDACKVIHENGGLVFLHAGNKSNSIEQLDSDLKAALKTDMADMVDIFEVSNEKQVKGYRDIVFPKIKREFPCLITSDSLDRTKLKYNAGHSTDGLGKAFSWIKADLTFLGLKQILSEPQGRVYLGATPPKLTDIANNPTRYIDQIKVAGGGAWFDDEIALSPGLNAVIGKKGSGKSALVDIIALCGKSNIETRDYSFLTNTKFRKNHTIAKKYEGTLHWASAEQVVMDLDSEVDRAVDPERVKYLPQSFVEEICNEHGVSPLFQNEINKVIFSYVPDEKRLGALSLDELIRIRADAINAAVERGRNDIVDENAIIATLETKNTPEYKRKMEKALSDLQKEHDAIKDPAPVAEPKDKLPKEQQQKLEKIEASLTALEEDIRTTKEKRKSNSTKLAFIDTITGKLNGLEADVEKVITTYKEDAKSADLDLEEVVKIDIDRKILEAKQKEFERAEQTLAKALDEKGKDPKVSLFAKQAALEENKKKISESFTDQHKIYQAYLKQKKVAADARKKLMGTKSDGTLQTILSLQTELDFVSTKLEPKLKELYGERRGSVKKLAEAIIEKISLYKEVYEPLISFIEEEKEEQERTGNMLTFDAGIVFDKVAFSDGFLKHINQGKDGSFQYKDGGSKKLQEIINKHPLDSAEEIADLIEELLHNLKNDTTKATPLVNELTKQLSQGTTPRDLYDFLYKLEYLDVRFKIRFNGKDLNENIFSPGEKGALLLIFYLLIDMGKIPLIMDQPEENLDNESVYQLLVPYIKRAKEHRQIIIVTHNPNLGVVCDAEQVICATMDKGKSQIRYEAGSIEDPATNKKIVDILEGTMPAFKKRDEKYLPQ